MEDMSAVPFDGECSSVGRALDCGSSGRGFDPHHSPHPPLHETLLSHPACAAPANGKVVRQGKKWIVVGEQLLDRHVKYLACGILFHPPINNASMSLLQNSDLQGPPNGPPGARASRPHPCASFLWPALSFRPVLKGAGLSAVTSTAKSKQTQGAVPGSIHVAERAKAVPEMVRAGRPRSRGGIICQMEHGGSFTWGEGIRQIWRLCLPSLSDRSRIGCRPAPPAPIPS